MNNIYNSAVKNRSQFKKRILQLLLGFLSIIGAVHAQVSVTATAGLGSPGPFVYTTLKVAFDSINSGYHKGDININLTGNTTESVSAVLNSSFTPSSYTSVLIKPLGGARTISGNIAGAIIKLNGADNVTIDGFQTAGPARDLTITNSNASPTTSVAVWVASASSTDGASSIIVQNCNINGSASTTSYAGIVQSSGTTIGSVAETENSGNSYTNNLITSALNGIKLVGPASLNDTDNNITGNSIGSVTAGQKLGHTGIHVEQQTDIAISGNTIFGVTSTAGNFTFQTSGIYVGGIISGGLIEKNKISDIKIASVWGCNGIQLNSNTVSTNMTIANNFIWDIAAGGFVTSNSVDDNGFGIAVNTGGGYRIYYNSVDMSTNQGSGITAAFWVSGITGANGVNNLNVRNNIFSNRQTVGTRYAIYSNLPNTVFSAIDYNDYFSNQSVGYLGTARATLVAWQTATAQDVNSVAVNPVFTSTTNLHLLGNSPLEALAIPIAGITQDIDNDVRNATTPDIGADEFTPPNCSTVLPTTAGTASISRTEICVSGSAVLSSSGYSYGIGTVYQWQVSTDGGSTFSNLAGETNPLNGNTGVITASRCYRLRVTCNAGAPVYSNVLCITVNSPTASGTGASRCGVGTVNLTSPNSNTKWYDVPTGGTFIGQGSPFTTPVISSTTTFYVTTTAGGSTMNGGKPSTNGADGTFTYGGIYFTANETFTLNTVVMYPLGAGTNTIDFFAGSTTTGTPIATRFATFSGSNPAGVTVPIGVTLPPGSYTIFQSVQQAPCWRDYSASAVPPVAFPYNIGTAVTLTQGTLTNFYYFFYNWNITTGCESARVPVTATVTTPPAVNITTNPSATFCLGDSTILTATSANGGYVYTWTPGNLSGPGPHTVFPTEPTVYTVIANDGTCRNDVDVTITVNNAPAPMTVSPTSASVCPDAMAPFVTTPLVVTGGTIIGQTIFNENAETWPLTKFAIDPAGTGVTLQQNTIYYQQGLKSIHLKHGDNALGQLSKTSPNINLSTYTNPELTFWHIAALEGTVANPWDIGFVDYSLDGGATWTNFPVGSYGGSGTLHGGGVGFNQSSYSDWDAQFSISTSTPGPGPATALWKKETIDLSTWQTNTQFRIRFRIDSDGSIQYYGWLIDNINVKGTITPITWSPVTNLWLNAAGTVPYTAGTFASTVYFNATANTPATTYTATSTAGFGCTETAQTTITATSIAASVNITANPGTTICAGSSVTFTANLVNGGGSPGYQWYLDPVGPPPAVQISPVGFNPGLSPYTVNGLVNGDAVYVRVLSSAGGCLPVNPIQSNTITFTVNPTPSVNITGGTTVCTGAPTTLTANATIGVPGLVTGYQWYVDGNIISGATASTYNATAPGGSYTVVAISNQGCRDTSNPHIVTQPTFTITATTGANGTISPTGTVAVPCGNNITFTITPNTGFIILDVLVDGVTNPVAIATGSYTFTNVSANHTIHATFYIVGCANPANATTGGNDTICANANHTLVGSVSGGSTTGTWSSLGDGTFNPNNNYPGATSYTPGPLDILAGSTVITLTSGVPALPCLISTSSYTLTIRPAPEVNIVGQAGICTVGATSIWLVADTSATTQPITGFQWYNGGAAIAGQTNDSLLVTATGTYSVAAFSATGCADRDTLVITTYGQPTLTISGGPTICTGAETELTAVGVPVNGTIPPNGYQWYRNAVALGGANFATYLASSAGTYTARVTNSNGCRSNLSNAIVLTIDNSPLNGNYTIGAGPATCTNYVSFAAAIFDLNSRTISGNVRFDVQPGHVEGAPNGGLALGSAALNPTTAGRTIQFLKNGAGANPLINAYTGGTGNPATAAPDGIWSLRGVDNVTISEVDLVENPANTTVANMMEYGFGIFKLNNNDGSQNNTIQNCNITLSKTNSATSVAPMPEGSNGIAVVNATAIAATTALVPGAASGANSNNKFYNNIITNCHVGVGLSGYAAPSPFTLADVGNDVGGTSALTGNNISNYGNTLDITAPVGIRIVNQWGVNASYNTIRNNNGSGVNTTNDLRGIRTEQSVSAAATIIGNTITLTNGATGGQQTVGIDNGMGSTAAANTILISNNIITASAPTVTTGIMTGINNTSTAATVNIANNTIQSCTLPGTGTFAGILNSVIPANLSINNNTIENNTKASTGIMTLIGTGSPTNATINDNTITGNVLSGGAIASTLNCVLGGTSNYILDANTIDNNSISNMSGAAVGTIYGYHNQANPLLETLTNNNIRRLFITGTGASTGLHVIRGLSNVTSSSSVRSVAGNFIDSLYSKSTFSAAISGIFSGPGANVSINRNRIHSLFPGQSGIAGAFAKGIQINSGTGVKVFNNMISLNLTQAFAPAGNNVLTGANAVAGIDISAGSSTSNIYFNTIRLQGNGAAGFGSSGISLAVTTATADIRNNIVVNLMTVNGGLHVGLRRTAVALTPGYSASSNNNAWHTTETATTPVYYNGVTPAATYATLAAFKAHVTPRETASINDLPIFESIPLNNLHLDSTANNCAFNSAGIAIAGYTTDYDADIRSNPPDIGADEGNGGGGGSPIWKGVDTNWENPNNWCGVVPTITTDVVIPSGAPNYPVIITSTPVARNININTGGSITIDPIGTLSTKGSWTNDGTLTNNGTIVLNGTVNQSFPGAGAGSLAAMTNLTVNNAGGATINKDMTLLGNLKPKSGNITVADTLTLHSDASGTARVDTVQGTISYSGAGKFRVERFISSATKVAWRFLSAPITGPQTIKQAWQEGETAPTYTPTGYGMQIVGPSSAGTGFDMNTTLPSLKKYSVATNTWVSTAGTNIPIDTTQGYMAFVRGDRGSNTFPSQSATTLRMAGPIKTGNIGPLSTPNPSTFISVGNPYPSAIDFLATTRVGLQNVYYLWDPKLNTYGGYQTFAGPGYVASPGGGSYTSGNKFIESGMAFFVISTAGAAPHNITITENSKVGGSNQVARAADLGKNLRTNLFLVSGGTTSLYDGVRVDFDPAYSNAVNDDDALKLNNFGENLGLRREEKAISVERRAEIVDTDTLYYAFGQLRQQEYQLEFTPEHLAAPGLTAFLEDAYLNTTTVISLDNVSMVNFTVNADAGSYAAERFRLVFKQLAIVPVSFTSVWARKQNKDILVGWKVENENNIDHYEIEKSVDGRSFTKAGTEAARGNGGASMQYSWLDKGAFSGDNFYRIISVDNGGAKKQSQTVKVNIEDPGSITVYPNPVNDDGIVNVRMENQPKGLYNVVILNQSGQIVLRRQVNHEGGSFVYSIGLSTVGAHGNYTLQVLEADKLKTTFKLLY